MPLISRNLSQALHIIYREPSNIVSGKTLNNLTANGIKTRSFAAMAQQTLSIGTKYRMKSGFEIPVLGYGVYQTPASVAQSVVEHAFKTGYRHVDSAQAYYNEAACVDAMRASGLPREQIFFTSKVPPKSMGYEATKKAIEDSFKNTGLDYIDLYLIHCPYGGVEARAGSWRALVEAQRAGKIRSLGVSNYGVNHLNELETYIRKLESQSPGSGGVISVGQWELHPWCERQDIVDWCRQRNIILEAYCPIVRNQRAEEPLLKELAQKYGKTPNQVLLRWSLQAGFVPLPKSENQGRIEENAALYGWELAEDDVKKLRSGRYEPCAWDPTTSGLDN